MAFRLSNKRMSSLSQHKKLKEKHIKIKDKSSGFAKKLILKTIRLPSGVVDSFFVNDDRNSAQIFGLTSKNEVITVLQWRPGNEKINIELPGGAVEEGEKPEAAAARELLEEVGFQGEISHIFSAPYTPYSGCIRHTFMAINCVKVQEQDLDVGEFLDVKLLPLDEFKQLMKTGQLRGIDLAYMALQKLNLL